MSDAGTESARMPNAIWEARRAAGLTEKALAERLGVSLWEVERLENGELDPSPYAEALERHTGRPRSSFRSNGASEPPQAKPSAEEVATPELISPAEHTGERLVLGSIAVLVLVRFFTEVVPVVPRAANFVDIPIVVALGVAALLRPPVHSTNDSLSRWLPALGFAFLILSAVAAILNPSRVDIAPALVFVYGVLSPLLVYGAVRRLWPVGRAMAASRLLIALGIVQLLVVVTIDIPRFAASSNPDDISGTFGTNAYQLVFFLLLFVTVLAGIYTHERERAGGEIRAPSDHAQPGGHRAGAISRPAGYDGPLPAAQRRHPRRSAQPRRDRRWHGDAGVHGGARLRRGQAADPETRPDAQPGPGQPRLAAPRDRGPG